MSVSVNLGSGFSAFLKAFEDEDDTFTLSMTYKSSSNKRHRHHNVLVYGQWRPVRDAFTSVLSSSEFLLFPEDDNVNVDQAYLNVSADVVVKHLNRVLEPELPLKIAWNAKAKKKRRVALPHTDKSLRTPFPDDHDYTTKGFWVQPASPNDKAMADGILKLHSRFLDPNVDHHTIATRSGRLLQSSSDPSYASLLAKGASVHRNHRIRMFTLAGKVEAMKRKQRKEKAGEDWVDCPEMGGELDTKRRAIASWVKQGLNGVASQQLPVLEDLFLMSNSSREAQHPHQDGFPGEFLNCIVFLQDNTQGPKIAVKFPRSKTQSNVARLETAWAMYKRNDKKMVDTGVFMKGDRLYFNGNIIHQAPPVTSGTRKTLFCSFHSELRSTDDGPVFESEWEAVAKDYREGLQRGQVTRDTRELQLQLKDLHSKQIAETMKVQVEKEVAGVEEATDDADDEESIQGEEHQNEVAGATDAADDEESIQGEERQNEVVGAMDAADDEGSIQGEEHQNEVAGATDAADDEETLNLNPKEHQNEVAGATDAADDEGSIQGEEHQNEVAGATNAADYDDDELLQSGPRVRSVETTQPPTGRAARSARQESIQDDSTAYSSAELTSLEDNQATTVHGAVGPAPVALRSRGREPDASLGLLLRRVWNTTRRRGEFADGIKKSDMIFFFYVVHHMIICDGHIHFNDEKGCHYLGPHPKHMYNILQNFPSQTWECVDVPGDGSCWAYSVLACCGLFKGLSKGIPSSNDQYLDWLVRVLIARKTPFFIEGKESEHITMEKMNMTELRKMPIYAKKATKDLPNLVTMGGFSDDYWFQVLTWACSMRIIRIEYEAAAIHETMYTSVSLFFEGRYVTLGCAVGGEDAPRHTLESFLAKPCIVIVHHAQHYHALVHKRRKNFLWKQLANQMDKHNVTFEKSTREEKCMITF